MSLDFSLSERTESGREICVESFNATHNLTPMWRKSGCYEALYESDGRRACDVSGDLHAALHRMLKHYDEYDALNPANGWGDVDGAIAFLVKVIITCERHPRAVIGVSR